MGRRGCACVRVRACVPDTLARIHHLFNAGEEGRAVIAFLAGFNRMSLLGHLQRRMGVR